LAEPIEVNVRKYQVDTKDYKGMRETIEKWIEDNSLDTTTAYCALNYGNRKKPFYGIVDTGMKNVTLAPVINSVEHSCLEFEEAEDGTITGKYISVTDLAAADAISSKDERQEYIDEHAYTLEIKCCVLDKNGKILGYVEDLSKFKVTADSDVSYYYIANYEESDEGIKNVKLITEEQANELLVLYVKTYTFGESDTKIIQDTFKNYGLAAVKKKVDETFADKEAAQDANKNEQDSEQDESDIEETKEEFYDVQKNSEDYLGKIQFGDAEIDINDVSFKDLENLGFKQHGFCLNANGLLQIKGLNYVNDNDVKLGVEENDDQNIVSIIIDSNVFECFNGLKVGMTLEDVLTAVNMDEPNADGHVVLKSKDSAIVVRFDSNDDTVHNIYVLGNDRTNASSDDSGVLKDNESDTEKVEDSDEETTEENSSQESHKNNNDDGESILPLVLFFVLTLAVVGVVVFLLIKRSRS
jgi:hypothetical protein